MARHGANYASPCRLDRLPATKMARLGTPYCGALREQNLCQCEACYTVTEGTWSSSIYIVLVVASIPVSRCVYMAVEWPEQGWRVMRRRWQYFCRATVAAGWTASLHGLSRRPWWSLPAGDDGDEWIRSRSSRPALAHDLRQIAICVICQRQACCLAWRRVQIGILVVVYCYQSCLYLCSSCVLRSGPVCPRIADHRRCFQIDWTLMSESGKLWRLETRDRVWLLFFHCTELGVAVHQQVVVSRRTATRYAALQACVYLT